MLRKLDREDKLKLLRFLCSFAWADLDIDDQERALVERFIDQMGLERRDAALARGWLDHPPREDDLDPYSVPEEHKKLFLEAVLVMMGADGVVDRMEVESFALFEALMGQAPDLEPDIPQA